MIINLGWIPPFNCDSLILEKIRIFIKISRVFFSKPAGYETIFAFFFKGFDFSKQISDIKASNSIFQ